jgi:hypothetical protein
MGNNETASNRTRDGTPPAEKLHGQGLPYPRTSNDIIAVLDEASQEMRVKRS